MEQLRFDGRVVVVTGAGAGLGRCYALLFAERGASVVVNDLGGSRHGDGKSSNAADTVVDEIRRKGGKAVADYNSVEDGDKIIETALKNFGRIDVVVNNAGILRDKSFARISNTDWDLIHAVHLKGTFKTTQAAWPHFRKQNYGRVIVTSSNSGLYGNFGQANYSAAKMGVVGLSNTLAIEGQKNNIHCNVIAPTAASRLTEDILPPDFFAELRPELIAPVVVWLCHESCDETGSIIESAVGWAGKCHLVRAPGSLLRSKITDSVTPEDVRDNWGKVTDMSKAVHYDTISEVSGTLMGILEELKANSEASSSNADSSYKSVVDNLSYDKRDLILYALGVGASVDNTQDLKYLYEGDSEFSALPTFLVIPGLVVLMESSLVAEALPKKDIDLTKFLHGEQYLEILKPIPTAGTLTTKVQVVDVLDKGSGAVIIVDANTFDEQNERVAYSQITTFVIGAGGFGGKKTSSKAILPDKPPARAPDASVRQKTSIDQAAIYRLSGDWNPLHIDPSLAVLGGFEKPILHGLCSFGFSARHVLQQYADNDPSKIRAIKVRFAKPVLPGQTLQTDMWQTNNRIHFETKVVETGTSVITGAYVDLTDVPSVRLRNVSSVALKSDEVFNSMQKRVDADIDKVKKINGVFLYKITVNGKDAALWTVDCKKGKVYKGQPESGKADTTIIISDDDFVDLTTGKLNPQVAFMQGKLKVQGNIMLVQKLRALTQEQSKL